MPNTPITSLNEFIKKISLLSTSLNDDEILLFRGQRDKQHHLNPNVLRESSNHPKNEHIIFRELVSLYPDKFESDKNTLEQLIRAQHYELPTRLLDLTFNPLVALYFAIGDLSKNLVNGKIFILKIKKDKLKYYDSDTASCIANLAYLSFEEKNEIIKSYSDNPEISINEFCKLIPVTRLLHFIKDEKPHFHNNINPADLFKVIAVKSKMNNERIIAQSGAFLLFGLNVKDLDLSENIEGIEISSIEIHKDNKEIIKKELDSLNINDSSMFPSISAAAKYISSKYKWYLTKRAFTACSNTNKRSC